MPDVKEFFDGFGIKTGITLAGYYLIDAQSSHTTLVRYQKYEYKITLTFNAVGSTGYDVQQLVNQLYAQVLGPRTIYTRYGNPYTCTFGIPEVADPQPSIYPAQVIVRCVGSGIRDYVTPKKKKK